MPVDTRTSLTAHRINGFFQSETGGSEANRGTRSPTTDRLLREMPRFRGNIEPDMETADAALGGHAAILAVPEDEYLRQMMGRRAIRSRARVSHAPGAAGA